MSFLDSITNMAKGVSEGSDHAAVAGGLMQELGGAGGVASLIQSLHQNGAGGLVQQWANGQTQSTNPAAIEQALGGSALIDSIAQRTGLSADTVRSSLATVVPLVVNHLTSNRHVTTNGQLTGTPAPEPASLIQSILGKLL